MMEKVKLEKGFKVDHKDEARKLVILQFEKEGFVTLDLKRRGFSLGYMCYVGAMKGYTGCGWLQRLANDAMKELRSIYDTPTKVAK